MSRVLRINSRGPLGGSIRPPSDKSLTHRALLFAALAEPGDDELIPAVDGPGAVESYPVAGKADSIIQMPLEGEDCLHTASILQALGAQVIRQPNGPIIVRPRVWTSPDSPLDCGNSGTTMRLMAGALASRPGIEATLFGDASLSRRPMKRIVDPLTAMGASITGEKPPLTLSGRSLKAIHWQSPVASAQVKTCVLLAGSRAAGTTWVTEPSLSRNHTELMLKALGAEILQDGETTFGIKGGATWNGFAFKVPGDISSAAFWMAAGALIPGSQITLKEVGVNPTRSGILDVFAEAGISVVQGDAREELGEPSASLTLHYTERPNSFTISGSLVPRLIDEIPVLAVLATQCHGTTVIRDAAELKVKESDRIALVCDALTRMGAKIEAKDDGMVIHGPTPLIGTEVDANGDHRIAMAFAIAGLIAEGETVISGAESIDTSYPNFSRHLDELTSQNS